jgi:hypothetical protein
MDGQTEQVNQILEDMLRASVMEYPGTWDKNLLWAEFSYNNSYQESLKMAHLRYYMDVDATHRSFGLNQERKLYLVLTSSMRLKQWFILFKTT